jgi:hypothetical protein
MLSLDQIRMWVRIIRRTIQNPHTSEEELIRIIQKDLETWQKRGRV